MVCGNVRAVRDERALFGGRASRQRLALNATRCRGETACAALFATWPFRRGAPRYCDNRAARNQRSRYNVAVAPRICAANAARDAARAAAAAATASRASFFTAAAVRGNAVRLPRRQTRSGARA